MLTDSVDAIFGANNVESELGKMAKFTGNGPYTRHFDFTGNLDVKSAVLPRALQRYYTFGGENFPRYFSNLSHVFMCYEANELKMYSMY